VNACVDELESRQAEPIADAIADFGQAEQIKNSFSGF
jgi:hypothetical protein